MILNLEQIFEKNTEILDHIKESSKIYDKENATLNKAEAFMDGAHYVLAILSKFEISLFLNSTDIQK